MTNAEKMARTLDSVNCNLDGEYRDDIPEDAAEMIRRLAAALKDFYEGRYGRQKMIERHATALRDVKEVP